MSANAVQAVARHSHNPCARHWAEEDKIFSYLNGTRDLGPKFVTGPGAQFAKKTKAWLNEAVACPLWSTAELLHEASAALLGYAGIIAPSSLSQKGDEVGTSFFDMRKKTMPRIMLLLNSMDSITTTLGTLLGEDGRGGKRAHQS